MWRFRLSDGYTAQIEHLSKCIHLLECFDHRNHICIVTELLGKCVYDFLKENEFVAFPRAHIQSFARQLLDSVACEQPFTVLLLFSTDNGFSFAFSTPCTHRSQAREHSTCSE